MYQNLGLSIDLPGFGILSTFQDLVSVKIDPSQQSGDMTVLGHVNHKLVCTPDFEHLLNST